MPVSWHDAESTKYQFKEIFDKLKSFVQFVKRIFIVYFFNFYLLFFIFYLFLFFVYGVNYQFIGNLKLSHFFLAFYWISVKLSIYLQKRFENFFIFILFYFIFLFFVYSVNYQFIRNLKLSYFFLVFYWISVKLSTYLQKRFENFNMNAIRRKEREV